MTDIIQGTPEWFAARCGKVTASRIADLMSKTKTGWGAGRKNYMAQLVVERLTGAVAESYTNAAMQWGTDTEPQARAAYEFLLDVEVVEIGIVDHPTIEMSSASPDGLVGNDGMVEIKCPNSATHIETLLSEKIPAKYIKQMQWQMKCAEREWCDYVSYDPRLSDEMQMWSQRVMLDESQDIEDHVRDFIREVDNTVSELKEKFHG